MFVLNEMASMADFRQIVTFFDYYCRNKPDFLNAEDIKSSMQRDVGSGYGIDIFTITKEGIKKVLIIQMLFDKDFQ